MKQKIQKLTKSEVIEYFGGVKKTADALGLWPQTIYAWHYYAPEGIAYKLEVMTKGELRAVRVLGDDTLAEISTETGAAGAFIDYKVTEDDK